MFISLHRKPEFVEKLMRSIPELRVKPMQADGGVVIRMSHEERASAG